MLRLSRARLKLISYFMLTLIVLKFTFNGWSTGRLVSIVYDDVCQCFRDANSHQADKLHPADEDFDYAESNCGRVSTARGPGQRVISYALHGRNTTRYLSGVAENAILASKYYPGFVVRVYVDPDGVSQADFDEVCNVACSGDSAGHNIIVDVCDAGKIQGNADLPSGLPTVWRFAPMSDPTVSEWHSRDLDSRITNREAAAVNEWRKDNYEKPTFHVMTDHPEQLNYPIQGGMFGMRNYDGRLNIGERTRILAEIYSRAGMAMLQRGESMPEGGHIKFMDQIALEEILLPYVDTDRAHYASFGCTELVPNSKYRRAFPTKRQNGEFVANRPGEKLDMNCPQECRKQAKWEQC